MEVLVNKEVWVIGVDPPCPRCDLTRQRAERLARELGPTVRVSHLVYSDAKAQELAKSLGKECGTAMDVTGRTGIRLDGNYIGKVRQNPPTHPEDIDLVAGPAKQWSPELDEALRPCQEAALSVGLLMTPIVVVNGEVKHQGSVPSIEELRSWLS